MSADANANVNPKAQTRRSNQLRCPTCGARQGWSETCRRCGCEFDLLARLTRSYDDHDRRAREALQRGDPATAWEHARTCFRLDSRAEAARLLAVTALAARRFDDALVAARMADKADS